MNLEKLYNLFLKSTGVCTDTRQLKKGNLYIALKGDHFDGNKFAQSAIEKGAIAAIVDEENDAIKTSKIYLVEDGLVFLQLLAQHHRRQLKTPIISLTGSNGKTTTKELIATCLSQKFTVAYTQGNLNNHIGVPLTLLKITKEHDFAIVEMGANHQKEIELLCAIAEPDYGYITNFGKAHLEGFGGFEGVVKGKSELYDYLRAHNKTAIVNLDDPIQIEKSEGLDQITFGFDTEAQYNFKQNSKHGYAGISYHGKELESHLSGAYNETNIAAAVTIALYFGIEIEKIQKGLSQYIPKINRSQEIEKSGFLILLDAYNANPSSMEVALSNFSQKSGTKTAILGDMFELGISSAKEHQRISDLAASLNFEQIFLIGENFHHVQAPSSILKFKTREDYIKYLKNNPPKTENILIKGSRGMALEKILEFI
ncbi:UDP-N-acetylmuramoyl-tripeptide--D-alanyl-D-alanine ligase [Flavobacteriaceae bacterium Ap0902]|nr:UDP-N-acetylmuramoyl-tripeptide--D-alanyl-D-alanine ligase [Flavobacteriaceae bacterium Ap0902]